MGFLLLYNESHYRGKPRSISTSGSLHCDAVPERSGHAGDLRAEGLDGMGLEKVEVGVRNPCHPVHASIIGESARRWLVVKALRQTSPGSE